MSTATAAETTATTISADEFQALEQKVLRTVELIKAEREARDVEQKARLAAEAELEKLRSQMQAQAQRGDVVESELSTLRQEREAVRKRVEKMLQQLDELA